MKQQHIYLIVFGFVILALMATNPGIEDHREAVRKLFKEKMNENSKSTQLNNSFEKLGYNIGENIGAGIAERIIERSVSKDNYYIFSVTNFEYAGQSKKIGLGIAGNVWFHKDINDKDETSSEVHTELQNYFDGNFFNEFYRKNELLGVSVDLNEERDLIEINNVNTGVIQSIKKNEVYKDGKDAFEDIPVFVEVKLNNGYTATIAFGDKEKFKNDYEMLKLYNQLIVGRKIAFKTYSEGSGELIRAYFSRLKFLD